MKTLSALAFAAALSIPCVASAQTAPQSVYVQPQQPVYAQQQVPQQSLYVQPVYAQPNYVQPMMAPERPKVIRNYVEGDGIPPGYHAQSRPRVGLAVAGGALFAATYFFTAVGGAAELDQDKNEGSHVSDAVLFIPVAGPFIRASDNDSLSAVLLVFDGLLQAAGAAMMIGGLVSTKTVLVRDDYAKRTITPVPIVLPNGGGAGVIGRF